MAQVKISQQNYGRIYSYTTNQPIDLEKVYLQFNLTVSDVVVVRKGDSKTAYYSDDIEFVEVPEFFDDISTLKDVLTGEIINTPRGSFYVTGLSRDEMVRMGFGYHHSSDDDKYLIMGNGTVAYAIVNNPD